jgi:hypothetical protein
LKDTMEPFWVGESSFFLMEICLESYLSQI